MRVTAVAILNTLLAALPCGPHCIVSPHPDDAALSMGGILMLLALSPAMPRRVLLTPFTRSIYAPGIPAESRTQEIVSVVRLQEDAAFASAVHAAYFPLDMPDASLRGYNDNTELGEVMDTDRSPGQLVSCLRAVIPSRLGVVWCPLAIGGHVDHILARNGVLSTVSADVVIIYYEDLPYAAGFDEATIGAFAQRVHENLQPLSIDIDSVWQAKLAGLRCYSSQLGKAELAAVEQAAVRRAIPPGKRAERIWIANGPIYVTLP
ncbi:MAG: PIG-L deacetylase family protein [Solidesulfovibrio sp. DCME]|uniref:PIG-L deacetylase family protein n=1 Tax=Solidesulfovibrio sp. DCME TaxID=3447380 RepID=UPI003D0C8CBC